MTDPNHGNSIITRLRLIVERLFNEAPDSLCEPHPLQHIRDGAENLLPLADVDDIEVIILREAAAILNGRGWHDLSDKVEAAGDAFAAEDAPRRASAAKSSLSRSRFHGSSSVDRPYGASAETAVMTQSEAEAIVYGAANTFITNSVAGIPLTHEGLNTIRNAAQQALERYAPGRWLVEAARPDSDWSRTPAFTVHPTQDTQWRKDRFKPGSR